MDISYQVLKVNPSSGLLKLQETLGGKELRVKLGRAAAASFKEGMIVRVRHAKDGRLFLEAETPKPAEPAAEAAPTAPNEERRAAPRAPHAGPVAISYAGKMLRARSRDIGLGGMALETSGHEQLQGTVRLAFRLPGRRRLLDTAGVVVRKQQRDDKALWGIGFRTPPMEVHTAIEAFLAAADPGGIGATGPSVHQATEMDRDLAPLYEDALDKLEH